MHMHGILGRASKEHVLDDRGRVASRKEKAYLSRFPSLRGTIDEFTHCQNAQYLSQRKYSHGNTLRQLFSVGITLS
jgi:acyl-ACP thioesterase